MTNQEILRYVDHTLLAPTATEADIRTVCDDAVKYGCASVCIPNTHIRFASEYVKGRIRICAVVGFPLGYSATETKCFEAKKALSDGASEIDMVANICRIKEGRFGEVQSDIAAVREAVGDHVLKVIIETCLLTAEEKIRMCDVVYNVGADYIKTSTGFSSGGATREDVALFAAHIKGGLKIKAAGGIKSFQDAEEYIRLGASRLGTSSLVKIMKKEESGSY
jgi:deoxyribose-phosphate aldolase